MKTNIISQELIKSLFDYRDDGVLIRKIDMGTQAHIGNIIGSLNTVGYRTVSINNNVLLIHRLVFLYHHGYMPNEIDHINGVRDDNRIENLRSVTHQQNIMNSNKMKNTTSKYKGVCWDKSRCKWMSKITKNGKCINLGRFIDEQKAASAYNDAARELFGEYANLNTVTEEL